MKRAARRASKAQHRRRRGKLDRRRIWQSSSPKASPPRRCDVSHEAGIACDMSLIVDRLAPSDIALKCASDVLSAARPRCEQGQVDQALAEERYSQ